MRKTRLLSLCFASLFSIILSCTDHFPPDPLPNHQRIKKITQKLPGRDTVLITDFFYVPGSDTLARLEAYKSPDFPFPIRIITSYSYGANGEPHSIRRSFAPFDAEEYSYNNDPSGPTRQFNYYTRNSGYYFMFLTYNGNQLESTRRTTTFSSVSFEEKIWYFFKENNLDSARYETTLTKNIPTVTKSKSEFTYDDKVNPFYGKPIIPAPNNTNATPNTGNFSHYTFAGGLDSFVHLSRNNVLSEKSSTLVETTYSYTYSSDGLPLTRVTMKKNTPQDQPHVEETLEFEYETF